MTNAITTPDHSALVKNLRNVIDSMKVDQATGVEEGMYEDEPRNDIKLLEALADQLETPKFPNGFQSWMETHHEVVCFMTRDTNNNPSNENEITRTQQAAGCTGLYELAEQWTDEFEKLHYGREWDGEFIDEVESFCFWKAYGDSPAN